MKRIASASVIALSLLVLPAALLAQNADGTTVQPTEEPAAVTDRPASNDTTAPATAPETTAVAPTQAPVAAPETGTPAPTTTAAPRPTPQLAQAPAPAQPDSAPVAAPAAPSSEPAPLEDVQGSIEDLAEYAPQSLQPVLEAVAWTLGTILAFLGLWEWLKRRREKKTGKCDRCDGSKEGHELEKCARCGGAGKIEEEYEKTVKCTHCKGSGTDPCHHCGGTGKMSGMNPIETEQELEGLPPCDFCGGSGQKRIGAGRDWGEANDAVKNGQFACCFCKGKKEETFKVKREVACPDCKGKGTK